MMKSGRAMSFATVACAVAAMALLVAACGGGGSTTTTEVGAPTTVQVVTTAAAGTLESYRTEMKALWDQYSARLDAVNTVLDTVDLNDPSTITDSAVSSTQDFVDALKGFIAGLQKIAPPADLTDAHATYLRIMNSTSGAFDQFLAALKSKDATALSAAKDALTKVYTDNSDAMDTAKTTLETALGFKLSTSSSAATEALGSDAKTYTDSQYGFTFQYPAAWEIDKSTTAGVTAGGGTNSSVGAFDPKGAQAEGAFIDLMMVSPSKLNVTVTDSMIPDLRSEIEGVLSQLESQDKNLQVVSPLTQTEKAGLKGYEVGYTFDKKGTPATSTLYFLFKGNMEYQVSIQAATADWDKNQAIFAAMVASFKTP